MHNNLLMHNNKKIYKKMYIFSFPFTLLVKAGPYCCSSVIPAKIEPRVYVLDFSLRRLFHCLLYVILPLLHKYMTTIVKRSDDSSSSTPIVKNHITRQISK